MGAKLATGNLHCVTEECGTSLPPANDWICWCGPLPPAVKVSMSQMHSGARLHYH